MQVFVDCDRGINDRSDLLKVWNCASVVLTIRKQTLDQTSIAYARLNGPMFLLSVSNEWTGYGGDQV